MRAIGGIGPYELVLTGGLRDQKMTSADGKWKLDNLEAANYRIQVTDSWKQQYGTGFSTAPLNANDVQLAPLWTLGEKAVLLSPATGQDNGYSFQWRHEGQVIGSGRELTVDQPGDYELDVSNRRGCRVTLKTKVITDVGDRNGLWRVVPNPARQSQEFTVHFAFTSPESTVLTLADVNGKIIVSKDLGVISNYDFNYSLLTEGTYLVMVYRSGATETAKLIIK